MKIEIEISRCGDCGRYWTYHVSIDGRMISAPDIIYRMYRNRQTAVRNAYRVIDKYLAK